MKEIRQAFEDKDPKKAALAVVQFNKEGIQYQRKYFISYPDNVMVMKFTASKAGKQNLNLRYCPNSEAKSNLRADGESKGGPKQQRTTVLS